MNNTVPGKKVPSNRTWENKVIFLLDYSGGFALRNVSVCKLKKKKKNCVLSKCWILFTSHLQLIPSVHWIKTHSIYCNKIQKWLKLCSFWNQTAFQLTEQPYLDTSNCRHKAAFQFPFAGLHASLLTCIIYSVNKGTFYLKCPGIEMKLFAISKD